MDNYVRGKSIIVTGGASGFGRIVSEKAAQLGGRVTLADIDATTVQDTAAAIRASGGEAQGVAADVTSIADMKGLAAKALEAYDRIDVMINNAGVMPLAFYGDHEVALAKWHRCIDINFKGVLNGIVAVHDQMLAQGEGHVINVSSIYGNFPILGGNVYGATKAAVNYLSESLRVESRGKIKVTIVKPTGVPTTGLTATVVNLQAAVGIVGHNAPEFLAFLDGFMTGSPDLSKLDPAEMDYWALDPAYVADQVIHAINQPKGVSIGEVTVRAAGDHYIL